MVNDLEHAYQENYLVIDNPKAKTNCCLLIFSSNGLKKEKGFEYLNICNSKRIKNHFKRIIFVRDLEYRFYINGINKKINNISKMLKFIGLLTEGYKVYTCGHSSGGYMALLFGMYLKSVDRVLSFGGILNVLDWHGSFNNFDFADFDAVKNASDEQKQYFDLRPFLNCVSCKCYFVYAGKAKADLPMIETLKNVSNPNVSLVSFNSSKHGSYNWSYDFKYLFTLSTKKLDYVFKKSSRYQECSRIRFSLYLQGPFNFFGNKINQIYMALKRRIIKKL